MINKKIITNITICSEDELNNDEKKLVELAKKSSRNSYAPYSNFNVGSAVMSYGGKMTMGANQENAAYSACICAERVALSSALNAFPNDPITIIAVAARKGKSFTKFPCTPCGECRQFLFEVEKRFGNNIEIIMYGVDYIYRVESIKDLLPLSFGNEIL